MTSSGSPESRGLKRDAGDGMIVNGFIEPITRTTAMEYASNGAV